MHESVQKNEINFLHIGVTDEKNISAEDQTKKQSPRIQTKDEDGCRKKDY